MYSIQVNYLASTWWLIAIPVLYLGTLVGLLPIANCALVQKQLRQTLQDPIQDVSPKTLDDNTLEKSLSANLQALTLMEDRDNQELADTQKTRLVASESDSKKEEKECDSPIPKYVVAEKVQRLQEDEQKYNIYMSMFGYEGDNSDLDSEMDMELEGHAYLFLDLKQSS